MAVFDPTISNRDRAAKTKKKKKPAAAPDQFVTIIPESGNEKLAVRALMDETPPTVTAGYGGWNEIARPGRRALVYWGGSPAWRMSLNLLLDGWVAAKDVENEISLLTLWAASLADFRRPTLVSVHGAAANAGSYLWAIDDLAWGDSLRGTDGRRYRQRVALTLVAMSEKAGTVTAKFPTLTRRVSGQNVRLAHPGGLVALQRLAQQKYGSTTAWKGIAVLNGIRTPARAKAGMMLRLP